MNAGGTVAAPHRGARRASLGDGALAIAVVVLVAAAIAVARILPWTPGSDPGYALGVAGGLAFIGLFLYPLRKRWHRAAGWGATRGWFAAHMTLGIAAPLLVVLHSKLEFGSLNATIAFSAMALVAASGVVGRFLYARIHVGLYGERASLAMLSADLERHLAALRAAGLAPAIDTRLRGFVERADATAATGLRQPWRYPALAIDAARTTRQVSAALDSALECIARDEGWSPATLARRKARRRALVRAHVGTVLRAARLRVHQRLFSWWHVLHVPLVWMLVATTVAHVIAVHMY